MAEEILYDEQVVTDNGGDPKDPLGLRKKLSETKKEKPDPLGLRAKLVAPKAVAAVPVSHEQALALPKIDYSKPVFQENVSESTAIPQVGNQALLAGTEKQTVAQKFENKVKESRDKVFAEITTNDKAVENLIRKQKFEEAGRNVELPTSDMPVQGALAKDVAQMVNQEVRPQDQPITPEELQNKKSLIANDDSQARRLLEEVVRVNPEKKKEVQKSIYELDVANALQNDPEGQANVRKVLDNSKKIENGELVYDFRNGTLIKPLNAFQSALQGWKQGSQVRDEFSIFNKMSDAQLSTMLDAQMATNQGRSKYDAVEVPEGLMGQMLQGLAMSPATTAGGAAGSLVGPEGAIAAGSILGAGEQSQRDYVLTLKRIYQELRTKGTDQLEAIKEAKRQALHAAGVGAVEGAAFGFIGARLGVKPLPKAALTDGFRNAVVNSLKSAGKTIGTATKEGLAAGGLMAGGEMYKNQLAKEAGIDRDIDEGVAESIESNLLFTLGMAGAIKAMKVGGKAYKSLISGLSKADDVKISGSLNEMLQNNAITEQQATKLQEDINAFRTEDATIPENVSPEARMKILEKIKKRNVLEKEMEAVDKAFHPTIKEQIKIIEEDITGLSKETVKPEKTDKELHSLIDDAIEEGKLADVMGNVAKSDPEGFMKFVADQSLGRTEGGEISDLPNAEYAIRDQYGDAIVDKALEMYPPKQVDAEIEPIQKVVDKFDPQDRLDFARAILNGDHEGAKQLLRKFDSDYSISSLANEIVTKSKEKYIKATDAQIDAIKKAKTPKDVLSTIIDTTSDPSLKEVAEVFHENIDKAPFLEFYIDIPKDRNGMPVVDAWGSYAGGKAHVRERAFWERKNNYFNKGLDTGYATILHEFTHAFTIDAYRKPKTPREREFKQYIDKTYKELKNNAELKDQYGFTSPEEFIAEVLVNPEFRLSAPIYKSGILDKIIEYLSKIFTSLKKVDKNLASDQRYEKMKEAFDYILKSVPDIRAGKGKDIYYSKGDKFSEFIAGVKDKTELLKKLGFTEEELATISSQGLKKTGISVIRPEERKQPTETITIKPEENASTIRSDQGEIPEGGNVGGQGTGTRSENIQQPAGQESVLGSLEQQAGTNKEGEAKGEEKIAESIQPNMYDLPFTPEEGDVTRLAHQDTEKIYKDLGLGDRIPRNEKTDISLEQQADELIKNGYDFNGKADKIIDGEEHSFTDAEQVAFAKMVGALKVKANKMDVNSPEFDAIQAKIEKLSRASDIVGSEEGAAFRARRLFVLNDETLSDFMMKAKKANSNAPLTETQKSEVKESFEKVTKAKRKYEKAVEKQTENDIEKKAEETVKKVKSTAKKDAKKDYVAERKQIFADIKEKLRKSRGETSVAVVPYVKDLFVVAPEIAKLVKNLVEQGIDKLPDIINNIHGQLKELIPDIKEKDVHDLIAGEYNEKKAPKSKIQEQVYDLQLQAKLINKLEALENGVAPKNENQKRKRSREVEELRTKIKGLQKELGTDKNALQALKARIKNSLAALQEKLKNKDYEPDAKSEPIVLDKEAQDLKDEYIAEKKKWDLEVAKQDYNNRPLKEKAWDKITGVLDLRRAIGTALDFSVPFRQALPVTINPLKIKTTADAFGKMFSHFASEKNLDRWWFDLENSPDYKAMIEDGLPVKSPNELRLSKREEEFRTNLAEEIPVLGKAIKASNRAASGYLNTMRVDLYRKGTEMLKEQGVTRANNPEAYKKLASGIGDLTGSGKVIGPLQGKPEQLLGNIFFGPKLMAAKFNLLNPYRYATMPKHIRIRALRDLGVRTGMYIAIGSLAKAAGWSVSLDPNDADFLKLKHGNTTYDITGGEAIYVRTALRILAAAYKRVTTPNATAKDTKSAVNKATYSTTSFFRNKLAPTPAYVLDAFTGKKSYGAPFDPYDIVRLYPMWIDDMVDDWKQEGPNSILAAAIPSIFGIGVQTKEEQKPTKSSGKATHKSKTPKHQGRKNPSKK